MNRRDLLELIEEGENIICEFKRMFTTPEKIAREMIAFANTKGGYIIFGVNDDREVIGVDSEKSESELIIDAAENYCEPQLKYSIDYVELLAYPNLTAPTQDDQEVILAVAVFFEKARLIDNLIFTSKGE